MTKAHEHLFHYNYTVKLVEAIIDHRSKCIVRFTVTDGKQLVASPATCYRRECGLLYFTFVSIESKIFSQPSDQNVGSLMLKILFVTFLL